MCRRSCAYKISGQTSACLLSCAEVPAVQSFWRPAAPCGPEYGMHSSCPIQSLLQDARGLQDESGDAQEAVAAETDLDGNAVRAMWRWTCYQAKTPSL